MNYNLPCEAFVSIELSCLIILIYIYFLAHSLLVLQPLFSPPWAKYINKLSAFWNFYKFQPPEWWLEDKFNYIFHSSSKFILVNHHTIWTLYVSNIIGSLNIAEYFVESFQWVKTLRDFLNVIIFNKFILGV